MASTFKVLKNETEYDKALVELEKLLKELEIGKSVGDELEVLGLLINEYESEHFPIENPHPIEAIKFMMEQRGMNNADLGELLGSPSRASEILNLKRGLTLEMIRILNATLQIPTDVLIQPYALKGAEKTFVEEMQVRQQERMDRLQRLNARFRSPHGQKGLKDSHEPTKGSSKNTKAYPSHGKSNSQVNEGRKNLKSRKSDKNQE